MFIGHFGLGFGVKKVAPAVSLGALFLACQWADLLWPTLVLLGIERLEIEPGATAVNPLVFVSYPYSHSLLALCVWGAVFGVLYAALGRLSRLAGALALAVLVLSHWVLDALTHRPDMPLTLSGTTRVGLNLWASVPATITVELLIFIIGLTLYLRTTAPRDRAGSIGLWSLAMLLLVIYLANIFGPPPPSVGAVAWSAEAMWLLVIWAYWIDGHRVLASRARASN
jgi:hypothetical protein